MKWSIIGTWKMSLAGSQRARSVYLRNGTSAEAVVAAARTIEDDPERHSVGFGGLPDEDGRVCLDAAFMNGDTLHFGAVGSLEGFRSPVSVASSLADRRVNNFLVAHGAERYARTMSFEERDNRTTEAMERYEHEVGRLKKLSAYDGHDTVCFLGKDEHGTLCSAVSTSGLFLKQSGRLGDSPVVGSGFYADSRHGACAATGLGEEIMRGCLSYDVVFRMKQGVPVQAAVDQALWEFDAEMKMRNGTCEAISMIAMDPDGNTGAATNVPFAFSISNDNMEPTLYLALPEEGKTRIIQVDDPNTIELD